MREGLNKPGARGPLPHGYARCEATEPTPVRLSGLFPTEDRTTDTGTDSARSPEQAISDDGSDTGGAAVPPGQQGRLDLDREVTGRLHHWERSLGGRWFGVVDPLIGDGVRPAKVVECGLVPAAALRPREPTPPEPLSPRR